MGRAFEVDIVMLIHGFEWSGHYDNTFLWGETRASFHCIAREDQVYRCGDIQGFGQMVDCMEFLRCILECWLVSLNGVAILMLRSYGDSQALTPGTLFGCIGQIPMEISKNFYFSKLLD